MKKQKLCKMGFVVQLLKELSFTTLLAVIVACLVLHYIYSKKIQIIEISSLSAISWQYSIYGKVCWKNVCEMGEKVWSSLPCETRILWHRGIEQLRSNRTGNPFVEGQDRENKNLLFCVLSFVGSSWQRILRNTSMLVTQTSFWWLYAVYAVFMPLQMK